MEPVELDFIYGGNTDTEGAKIEKGLDDIASASKRAQAEFIKGVAEQKTVVAQIESDIKKLEKQLSQAAPGNAKVNLTRELNAAKQALLEEKAALAQVEQQANETANSHVRLRTRIMEAKDALARMEMEGRRGTPEYAAMAQQLGDLTDQMGDTAAQARILGDDERGFKAVASGVTGITGAMAAATGAAALFGAENEELARIQTRLQAVMAITIGVQQVAEMLNKDSYFSVVLLTKAKNAWAVANLRVATTLGITAAASKALMLTGIGVLVLAIGGLIMLYDRLSTKSDESKKKMEEQSKAADELNKIVSDGYAKEQSKIEALRASLNSENISRDRKLGIIKQLKEQIPGYTAELDKEGNVIRENKKAIDQYMVSLEKSLKFRAAEKELEGIYDKMYKLQRLAPAKEQKTMSSGLYKEKTANQKAAEGLAPSINSGLTDLQEQANNVKKFIEANGLVEIETTKETAKKVASSEAAVNAQVTAQLRSLRKQTNDLLLKQRKDFIKDNQKATDTGKDQELDELKKARDEANRIISEQYDERTRIEKEYEERIKKVKANGTLAEVQAEEKKRDAAIAAATKGMLEETDLYKLLSDDKINIAKETTQKLLEELKKRIEAEIAAGKLSVEAGNKMLADVGKAQATVSDNKNKNNPFAQLSTAVGNNSAAQKAFKDAPVGTSTEELAKLESAANSAAQATAGAAGAALMGVKDILNSVVGGLDQLGLLTEEQKKDAENIIGMVSGAADLAMGIASGNPMQIIQGSIALLVNGIEYFDFKNKALVKSQKEHMKNVEELELKYKKLQRAVETALGTDVYKAQRSEIENQKQQVAEYEAWLALENQKKKRKRDQDKIAETKAKIDELKNSIEDEAKAITEALAQTDAKSLAGELADAITTAFTNGEDAALAFGDVAEQVMANAVKNALKLQFLEKPMQNAVDQLAKDMESGGALSNSEQNAFRDRIENAGKLYYEQLAQYSDLFTGDAASSQQGIKGDVAKMTEETGSALAGQITAMRLNVSALLANSKSSLDTVGKMLATLELIKTNTDRLNRIDETLYYLKLNGIKVL